MREWIIVYHGPSGTEEIDTFDTLEEAERMLLEYKLALRNGFHGSLSLRSRIVR